MHHRILFLNCLFSLPQGKKLDLDQADDGGEVTDEDEGAETNRTRANRGGSGSQSTRRLRVCRELSELIALNRGSSTKLPSSRDKSKANVGLYMFCFLLLHIYIYIPLMRCVIFSWQHTGHSLQAFDVRCVALSAGRQVFLLPVYLAPCSRRH